MLFRRLISIGSFLLLFNFIVSPLLTEEIQAESTEDLFEIEEEVKTKEWKDEIDRKLKEAPLEPEQYVVSGSKYAQSLREAPATMTVLDEEDIQAYGITTIDELLRVVPGWGKKTITPARIMVGIRGLYTTDANSVLVLVDGREVNSNLFGGVLWSLFPVTFEDIKRIEIIRGPGSVLYGANAFSGVINIVTKTPREEKLVFIKPEVGFYETDYGHASGKLILSRTYQKFSARGSASFQQTRSWAYPERARYQLARFSLRADYEFSGQTSLSIDGGFIPGETIAYSWIGNIEMPDIRTLYANVIFRNGPLRLQSNYRLFEGDFLFNPPSTLIPAALRDQLFPLFTAQFHNFESKAEYFRFLGRWNRLTIGANYIFNLYESEALVQSPQWEHRFGVFVQDEFRPREDLIAYIGARYDYNDATEEQTIFGTGVKGDLSPRISVVYLMNPIHTLRVSAGRAFRKPSFFEFGLQLKSFDILPPPLNEFGYSPETINEHINSYEISYLGQPIRRMQFCISAFFNQYRDTLRFGYIETYRYNNIDTYADSYGGELSIDFLLPQYLQGFFNYALLFIAAKDDFASIEENRFPEHKANSGIRWLPPSGPTLSLIFHWIGRYEDQFIDLENSTFPAIVERRNELGKYLLVNGKASYRWWNNRMEAGIKVFNLLNQKEYQYPGSPFTDSDGNEDNFGGEKMVITTIAFIRAAL